MPSKSNFLDTFFLNVKNSDDETDNRQPPTAAKPAAGQEQKRQVSEVKGRKSLFGLGRRKTAEAGVVTDPQEVNERSPPVAVERTSTAVGSPTSVRSMSVATQEATERSTVTTGLDPVPELEPVPIVRPPEAGQMVDQSNAPPPEVIPDTKPQTPKPQVFANTKKLPRISPKAAPPKSWEGGPAFLDWILNGKLDDLEHGHKILFPD